VRRSRADTSRRAGGDAEAARALAARRKKKKRNRWKFLRSLLVGEKARPGDVAAVVVRDATPSIGAAAAAARAPLRLLRMRIYCTYRYVPIGNQRPAYGSCFRIGEQKNH